MFIADGNLLSLISTINNFNNIDGETKNKKNYKNSTNLFSFEQVPDDANSDNFTTHSDKNKNVENNFKAALTSGNSYWEDDYANSVKARRNMFKMVELTPKEQTKLRELVDKYEKYRSSLSAEERTKLDKNKWMLFPSEKAKNNEIKHFDIPSKMTKQELLDILQDVDISNNKIDGKIGSFRQGRAGDCWLLATIKNISQSEQNSKILKDSVTQNKDGSYTVKFKGMDSYVKQMADNCFFNKFKMSNLCENIEKQFMGTYSWAYWEEFDLGKMIKPDFKPQTKYEKYFVDLLNANKNNEEYKYLNKEREDFIKEKTELLKDGVTITKEQLENNPLLNSEGEKGPYATGDGDVTLIEMATEKVIKTVTGGSLRGGSNNDANLLLLNKQTKSYRQKPDGFERVLLYTAVMGGEISREEFDKNMEYLPLSDEKKANWIQILESTSPEKLTAGSFSASEEEVKEYKENGNPDGIFMELNSEKFGKRRILKSHSYNISNVDKKNKIIYVQNPWESEMQIPLTHDEFFKCFGTMYVLQD